MLSRRSILILSIAIAFVLYAGLFALAPRISILRASTLPFADMERVRVQLRADVPERKVIVARSESDVIGRDTSVGDLLQRTHEVLAPWDIPKPEAERLEDVNRQLSTDEGLREYDFDAGDLAQKTVDAKIIAIRGEEARNDIKIARQFVRPSTERTLGADEFPVLRTDRLVDDYAPRMLPRIPDTQTEAEEGGGEAAPVLATSSPVELTAILPEEEETPPLKIEELQARNTVEETQSKARAESAYSFLDDMLDIALETWAPDNGEAGYFRLSVKPRNSDISPLSKDVTFVVDASSSISQNKLLVTARGVRDTLDLLRKDDHFNVVIFRDTPTSFQPQRVGATTENINAAKKFLENLESRGETDIYKGILPVVQEAPRSNAPGIVVVISDGRPTIGIRDSRSIINGLSSDNRQRNTIFAFGGGNTVNRQMLDLLAYRNKGDADVAADFNAIDEQLPVYFSRLNNPLLINVSADFGKLNGAEVYPKIIPDFYQEKAITLYGRFDPKQDGDFVVRISGTALSDKKEVIFKAQLKDAAKGTVAIAQRWAFQKAYHLIGEMSLEGETPDRLAELRALSNQYKIKTSYDE